MPTYFQRPENALKRANEMLHVDKKQRALDALYDVIKSKKHKTWQKIHEPIMKLYLELCVDLKKSHIAKEGLFQYRNICQQVNIKSLEDVVRGYLKLAEEKTEEARQQSQQAVVDIDDLDQVTTPESLLLSAVSGEDSQDRTDRVVLIPWVKFLWESYRQCLELLRNNSRVERLYHDIAQQAFKFCLNYSRKTEFRKLCDNLRTHLGQIHRHQHLQTAINLGNTESQQMHSETRLCQLDSAITMELWQEAYKAIEDVHGLMALSKKSRPYFMANYFQKLALVFWKAGNNLFHGAALFKLFHLSRDMKKNLTPEDLQKMATRVTLATLAIPLPPARSEVDRFLETDESVMEKNRKLAALLGLTNPPTRMSLVKDLVRHNVLPNCIPEIQNLYRWLEVEFHPLDLCSRIQGCINYLEETADSNIELVQYVPAIQNISVMRLLFQVSQVYQTLDFVRLQTLAPFLDSYQLEALIVDAARRNDLQVVIDHKNRSLHFGTTLGMSSNEQGGSQVQSMPGEQIRNQLVQMCDILQFSVFTIQPERKQLKNDEVRQRVVAAYKNTADKDHRNILQRRQIIEKRKEDLENQNIQREEEERQQQENARRNQQMAETERLRREAEERDRQRKLMELKEVQKKQVKDKIEQLKKSEMGARLFQDIDEEELENLDADMIMAKQVEQLDKERKELQSRLKSQEKKVDYMERAKRLEEIPLLIKDHEEFEIKDKENWEQQEEERIKECIAEREIALQTSERLNRIKADKDVFLSKLKSDRGADFRTKCEEFNKLLEVERAKRMAERREKRRRERKMKYQREKEEEEQLRHDEQLKNEREEEERAATARKEKMDEEYRKQKEKLDEIEAKQKAREKMIEMKLQRETEETTERPSRTAMAKDFRKEAADVPVKNDDTDGPRRNLDEDKVWRRSGRGGDDDSREDLTAAKKTDEGGSWRKPGSNEAWNKRGNDDRGSTEDRKTQDPREDRGPRDERWSRDPRDDRGPRDDRVGRDDRWSREPRDARSSRDDRWSRDPRDDRGPRDDRVPKDDRGPREDRWSRDPREDRGPRDDRWSRDSRDDRAPREDRWSRDPRDDRGPREDRWSRDSRDDRGPRGGGGSWSRGGEDRGGDSWRSKATEDRWNKGPDDRKRDTRDGGDNWRSKGSDERSFGNDKEFRREDDNLTNKRRVPADKDGFPADRMPAGGRRAPPPRGKDSDKQDDDGGWQVVR